MAASVIGFMITLTLITITKDDSEALELTLRSAASLRDAGAEYIVVDGSLNARSGEPPQGVRLVRRPPQGISDAFNAGLALARGEWVWFLNGGDLVDPRLAPEFLLHLLRLSRAQVLIGGTTYEGELEPRPYLPPALRWPPIKSWVPHPSTLVRRDLFARFGLFDERYMIAMDYEWWLRTLSRSDVAVDVISAPFAVFAPGGVSQRPESSARIAREQADGIRRHRLRLWQIWVGGGCRLLKATAHSFLRRLPG